MRVRTGYGCHKGRKLAEEWSGRRARRNVSSEKGKGHRRIALFHRRVTALRQWQVVLGDEQQMCEQGLHELAVGGIVQQREAEFGISVPGMRGFRREGRPRFCVPYMVMGIAMVPEFTLKVSGKDRVDGGRVDVPGFAMMGICLGMDMEERQG
ncbi:MAG: hypothetical protein GDA65_07235 [Nitrospira sp. CR1.1]|nr:hypothetical protein [Nitrospira sp. CR1.1]